MTKFVTVYALCYGDYPDLHKRLASSLAMRVPKDEANIVIWCNQVGTRSIQLLERSLGEQVTIYRSPDNVAKYKVMREMFHGQFAPETPWVMWLDDDSWIDKAQWWEKTKGYIEEHPDVCYMGQPWYVHHLPGQWEFIQKAEWYRGLEPEQCPTKTKGVTKPGINFAQGAYWWLRTDVMKQINWPDPRLNHNGGDTLLGEAVRQQSLPFHKYHFGVAVNKAKRRGYHETPAGSKVDTRR